MRNLMRPHLVFVFRNVDDDGDQLKEDIKLEASELLETLSLWFSENGTSAEALQGIGPDEVNDVFRPLHTLKGLCMMGEMSELTEIVHALEDKIAEIREGNAAFSDDVLDQLGDLLQIFEAYFAFFPDDIPDVVHEQIAEHKEKYHSEVSPQSVQSAEEVVLDEPDDVSEMVHSDETLSAEDEPLLGQDEESLALDDDSREEGDFSPSPAESARYAEFCSRPENMVAVLYTGEGTDSQEAIQTHEGYENLTRVAEVIFERSMPGVGTLVLVGTDLDAEMAGSLGQAEGYEIEKGDLGLSILPEPWNLIAFDSDAAAEEGTLESGTEDSLEEESVPVAEFPQDDPEENLRADGEDPADSAQPDGGLPYEDFDSQNQSGSEAAMELDQEMLDDFISNADDLLEELSQSMLDLEGEPDNAEAVDTIFRAAHTIKGTAGMFGFRAIEKLTHVMENTFDRIRKGELKASSSLMDGLLVALDRIKACFEELKEGRSAEISINEVLNQVLQADYAATHGIPLSSGTKSKSNSAPAESVEPQMAKSEGEGAKVSPQAPVSGNGGGGGNPGRNQDAPGAKKKKAEGVGTIRVDLKRLDALVNLVGELVIDRTRFARIEEHLRLSGHNSEILHTMSETLLLFGRHMNDVQSIIMKIRMVPIGNAFYKFTRVVRDLARTCGKEIDLVIEGGETELDKTLVEEIGDPLVHIIRNSADHGIESPEDRVAAGKSSRGTITLRAYQDGNMIVIFISDDGKGLQPEKIRAKALANGLIQESDALTEREIFNLIFEPGFSTAEQVTNISGRGVGMDAVKKSIVKLKGVVDVDSTPGMGTQISIKLPLTLAIIPSLLVESHRETYAIPLVNVIESIRIGPEDIQRIGHSDFVKLRDQVLPLMNLGDLFRLQELDERIWYSTAGIQQGARSNSTEGLDDHGNSVETERELKKLSRRAKKPRLIFVVVGIGEQRVGFIVDQLMGQQEIVIKSLGRIMGRNRGISGGCVLGNGRVALVLDVGELIDDHSTSPRGGVRVA